MLPMGEEPGTASGAEPDYRVSLAVERTLGLPIAVATVLAAAMSIVLVLLL